SWGGNLIGLDGGFDRLHHLLRLGLLDGRHGHVVRCRPQQTSYRVDGARYVGLRFAFRERIDPMDEGRGLRGEVLDGHRPAWLVDDGRRRSLLDRRKVSAARPVQRRALLGRPGQLRDDRVDLCPQCEQSPRQTLEIRSRRRRNGGPVLNITHPGNSRADCTTLDILYQTRVTGWLIAVPF